MISFTKNVAGIFVAKNRKTDTDNFCNEYRSIIPGFIGVQYTGSSDELIFNFDESLISPSTAHSTLVDILDTYSVTSLNTLRGEVNTEINAERDKRLYSFFPFNGYRWDCDSISITNIIGANTLGILNGGVMPPGFAWKDYDNNIHPMDMTAMAGLGAAMFAYRTAVYQYSWIHKGTIAQINNATDLKNYDVTVNWPSQSP